MSNPLSFLTLRDKPELLNVAAQWFHEKWNVPAEAYLECMSRYLSGKTEYGWFLCLDGLKIVAGLGVIENDFHDRKDLTPNVCALFVEPEYRGQGIAGQLLNTVCREMNKLGVDTLYLLTDHDSFDERYGWEFFCMAQGDGEDQPSRMYIHRS